MLRLMADDVALLHQLRWIWKADVLSHGVFWQTVRNDILAVFDQLATYLVKATDLAPEFALVLWSYCRSSRFAAASCS